MGWLQTPLTFLLAGALVGCAGPSRARPGTLRVRSGHPSHARGGPSCAALDPDDPTERACAVAHFDAERGVMEVRLRVEPGALPARRDDVALRFREGHFGVDYTTRYIDVPGRAGWPASLGRVNEPVELYYRVSLDLFERGEAHEGRAGVSWRRDGGWHLTGRSFLPDIWVDGEPVEVPAILVLDVGELPLVTSAGTEQRTFDAPSLIRLADEAYEVGPLALTEREVRGTHLYIGRSGPDATADLEETADLVARTFEALSSELGAPSTESVLLAVHPLEGVRERWGERLGSSLVEAAPIDGPSDRLYAMTVSVHETLHLWLPGVHHVREEWLEEGITDYLTVLVSNSLAGAPDEDLVRVVLRVYDAYVAGAGQRSLRDSNPTDPRWVYDAGLVAGFCLDGYLRANGSSLYALLRTTLGRSEVDLGTDQLLEDLAALSPEGASYLAALVEARGALEIGACLEHRGFALETTEAELFSARVVAVDVLGLTSLYSLDKLEGFVVGEVRGGSAFQPGDVVLRVAGASVATVDDTAYAIRDLEPGARFDVELRRRDAPMRIELTLDVPDDAERERRAYRTVTRRAAP